MNDDFLTSGKISTETLCQHFGINYDAEVQRIISETVAQTMQEFAEETKATPPPSLPPSPSSPVDLWDIL